MEKSRVELSRGKMAYTFGGKGKNLLLLHSLSLSGEAWKPVIGPLMERYSVFALDLFGHGDSEKPSGNLLIEDHAQSVIAFMDKLGIRDAFVCGNSVGGLISLEMSAAYPERVRKLVLVGCPARSAWERMERLLLLGALSLDSEGNPKPFSLEELRQQWVTHADQAILDWVNRERTRAGGWVKNAMLAIALYDVFPKLPMVRCPTLVVFGENDTLREKEKVFLREVRGSKGVVLKDAGHLTHIDKPQEFLDEITGFLEAR